jgi:2-polyprenyl-3-methyl-5-hydroxy-6-metoxy-1,4-benzoquinol methylase
MSEDKYRRFASLTFTDFRRMAQDDSLSRYEKIGFPDSYREGREHLILEDIAGKLTLLGERGKTVLDIGPGCSELPLMLIELCRRHGHAFVAVDSEEMLAHLPDAEFVRKFSGYYPHRADLLEQYRGRVDVILAYSLLHYVFVESSVWEFLDRSLELLAVGGQMLVGDIPNVSKRRRFFGSPTGVRFHQEFTGTQEVPEVGPQGIEHQHIDDAVVLSLVMRARAAGFDAYVVPQRDDLPMANRREDILIRRP